MIVANARPELSIVIPAHNEAENLSVLIAEILAVAPRIDRTFEIVIVDDHSTDNTAPLLERLVEQTPCLQVYRTHWQSGQSASLSAGFDRARGEWIVTLDGDCQNDPADIPALLSLLDTFDVAIGWRRDRKDPLSKKIISKIANGVRNWATGESIKDTGCGLKAFRREVVEKIHRFDGMHRFFPTLAKMHGFSVVEVPVHHRPRCKGRTHYNLLNRSIRPMADLLAIRWLQKRTLRYQLEAEHALVQC